MVKYNIDSNYFGSVPFYRQGHKKKFQEVGYYMNFALASTRIDPSKTPAFQTPYAFTEADAATLSLYKIEGAIESAKNYADIAALRVLVGSYVPPTVSKITVETGWNKFYADKKTFNLDNDSVYELVLELDDNTTFFESELMVTGCPQSNVNTIVSLKSVMESFQSAGKLSGETETFTLSNDIAQFTEVLFFVNGQMIKSFAKSTNTATILYPFATDTNDLVEIYYNYI